MLRSRHVSGMPTLAQRTSSVASAEADAVGTARAVRGPR
jgi:hypothetical protein